MPSDHAQTAATVALFLAASTSRCFYRRDGRRWNVHPPNVDGWFTASCCDANGNPGRGVRTLVGPGYIVLELSANPLIRDFDITNEVLAENTVQPSDAVQLKADISNRTRTLRNQH